MMIHLFTRKSPNTLEWMFSGELRGGMSGREGMKTIKPEKICTV
jgi:hypothetical protein